MGILMANLKFLYQRPALWLHYVFIGLYSLRLITDRDMSPGSLFSWIIIQVYLGMIIGSLWRETLSKPMSFCLPRMQNIPGPILLIAGTTFNLIPATLSAWPMLSSGQIVYSAFQVFCSVFFAGLSLFLITAIVNIHRYKINSWPFFFLLIYVPILSSDICLGLKAFLLSHPFSLTVFGICLIIYVWVRLGQRNLIRGICLNPSRSILSAWDQARMNKVQEISQTKQRAAPLEKWQSEKLEDFFLARMRQYDPLSIGRLFWGWFYQVLSQPRYKLEKCVLEILFYMAFGLFLLSTSSIWMIFVLPSFLLGVGAPLPVTHSLFFPAGRTEQFRTVIRLQITYPLLLMTGLLVLGFISQGLVYVAPQITLAGHTLKFATFSWSYFYLPVFIMPVIFLIRGIAISFSTIAATGLIVAAVLPWFFLYHQLSEYLPWFFIVVGAVCWPLCFLIYRYYFRRANLTG